MKNQGLVERIVPGTDLFQAGFAIHISRYEFARKIISSHGIKGKLLDVGCGTGYGTSFLCDYLPLKVTGIDNNDGAIKFAKKNYARKRLMFKKMDAQELKFPKNFFDSVISLELIEHLEKPEKLLRGVRKILRKNGVFVVSTPNKKAELGKSKKQKNPYHAFEFDQEEFEKILSHHFSEVTLFGQYFSNSFIERRRIFDLVSQLAEERNSVYLNLLKGIIPKKIRMLIPFTKRVSLAKRIYKEGKKKYAAINEYYQKMPLHPSVNDFVVDRFNLKRAQVFIAICRL